MRRPVWVKKGMAEARSLPPSFKHCSAALSHVGNVRTINEDSYVELPHIGVWAVADGMGGHEAGDVASQMVVEALRDLPSSEDHDALLNEILRRLQWANNDLQIYAKEKTSSGVAGTTVAILSCLAGRFACIWVGDSRIYQLAQNRLEQITHDHSHVAELVNLGLLNSAEAASHPDRNVLSRAVGTSDELAVDIIRGEAMPGDVFLLCSDGLNKAVSDHEIEALISDTSCKSGVEKLVNCALKNGATDNVTAIVMHVKQMASSQHR